MNIFSSIAHVKEAFASAKHEPEQEKLVAPPPVTPYPAAEIAARATKKEIRMSFGFASVEHALATVFKDIKVGAEAVVKFESKTANLEATAETVSSVFLPPSIVNMERIMFGLLAKSAVAAADLGPAANASGLNISLDQQEIADIKALVAAFPDAIKQARALYGPPNVPATPSH